MTIENRVLSNLLQAAKKGAYYSDSGLYIEAYSGGITVYAKNAYGVYRQNITGDNKKQFCAYLDDWRKKDGLSYVDGLERMSKMDGDKASEKICEFIKIFELERFNSFTVDGAEFRKAVNAVGVMDRGDKVRSIVISAKDGNLDIAAWNDGIGGLESAVWRLESKVNASGAVMVNRKYLDAIKGKTIEFAYVRGLLGLYAKTDDTEAVIAPRKIDPAPFLEVLEYEYQPPERPELEPVIAEKSKPAKAARKPVKRAPRRKQEGWKGWTWNPKKLVWTKVCNW